MRILTGAMFLLMLLASPLVAAPQSEEFDDCDANFIAFLGANAFRFSPDHEGELGSVRLFSVLSYQRAAHAARFGVVPWKLVISNEQGGEVLVVNGRARIDREGAAVAELYWDGRDNEGRRVPAGLYRFTFLGRFVADEQMARLRAPLDYDWVTVDPRDEALASSDEIVVDYGLTPEQSAALRISMNVNTACQRQQNAPVESGFPYNFYYGSTHAHSNWSDGGQPTSSCSSGSSYGSGTFTPSSVFAHARDMAGLDYWVVNEHNHLIQDAINTNNPPVTEAKVRQRYQDGIAAANAATTAAFVGLYGMEWGVTTNTDQGHLTLIETPALFGWETCSTCNGPNPECTPGTNCYFDVFTPKRYGYLTLYARSVTNPSAAGALGIFNHPSSGNFDNFAFDANADNAMQGIAVRSGLAFSTATDCATANIASTDYSARWREALNKGFHLAPAADHDSHCNNYGQALPTRTVYLAPSLSKANLMAAHRARRFYATEDPNIQLVFRTADGSHVMGDIFTAAGGATLVANVYDPDGESTSTLEIWRGQIGAGAPTTAWRSFTGTSSASVTETLTSGSYWYYVRVVQPDGHDAWSAPMWITYQAGGDTTAPSTAVTSPTNGATVSGTVSVTASATDNVGVTKVEFYLDGALQATDTASPYSWSWNTTASANGSHTLFSRAFDAANNVGTSTNVGVTVSNTAADTTAPTTSISSPTNGTTVSGTVNVTANASDNVGVTKVEFYLDGALQATDTTSPYSWSWNTTGTSNGAHTLSSRAYDAANNVGTSANVSVTVSNAAAGTAIGGWRITQANATLNYTIPAGTTIPSGGYVIVARSATRAAFETFWGVTLGSNVVFINAADAMPQVNGSETYTLYNSGGTKIDGATVAMGTSGGQSLQRTRPCSGANKSTSWSRLASSAATPGSGAPATCGKGVYIEEFSDALGTGNYVYEFVALYNDR